MGRDKARLWLTNGSLLEHVRSVCLAAGASAVLISGNYPEFAAVPDRPPDLGPVGGLASVLSQLADGALIVVPVDLPRLQPPALQTLHAAACACGTMAARFSGGSVLPLWIRLDPSRRKVIEEVGSAPSRSRSMNALFHRLAGTELPCSSLLQAFLEDCDTPEAWHRLTGREPPPC